MFDLDQAINAITGAVQREADRTRHEREHARNESRRPERLPRRMLATDSNGPTFLPESKAMPRFDTNPVPDSHRAAVALACRLACGEDVWAATVQDVRLAANLSPHRFEELVNTAKVRKAHHDRYGSDPVSLAELLGQTGSRTDWRDFT